MVLERVRKTITRYSMFKPGDRVGVAVSGGADSVFLLHALFELAPRWDLKLCALHLDHGLRGEESRGDADFVCELARRFALPAHISHIKALGVDVQGQAPAIIGKIEAARARGENVTADQYPWSASGTSGRKMPRSGIVVRVKHARGWPTVAAAIKACGWQPHRPSGDRRLRRRCCRTRW